MRLIVLLVSVLGLAACEAANSDPQLGEEPAKARCAASWPDDAGLQADCLKRQREAIAENRALIAAATPRVLAAMLRCAEESGDDLVRVNACGREARDAQVQIPDYLILIPAGTASLMRIECEAEWADDLDKVEGCVRRRAEEWRAIHQ